MENSSDFELPTSDFWLKYSALKEKLNTLKRPGVPLDKYKPLRICVDIENILDHEEEENLSFLPNKIRKLSTGSELFRDICVLQRHFSSLELDKTVSEVLEEEKYEKIAQRILSRRALENKREKFFLKQAQDTIRNSIGDETGQEDEGVEEEIAIPSAVPAKDTHQNDATTLNVDLAEIPEPSNITTEDLRMTKTRGLPQHGISDPGLRISLPDNELNIEEEEEILINRFPESLHAITGEPALRESLEEDSTPDLVVLPPVITPPLKKQRRLRPGFDESIIIPNYVERARRLNEYQIADRVEVYKGPPSIIEAYTSRHLFRNPAMHNKLYKQRGVSSGLERLYTRHLITEEMPHSDVAVNPEQTIQQDNVQPAVGVQPDHKETLTEEQKSSLVDMWMTQSNLEGVREYAAQHGAAVAEEVERLIGTPISKILQGNVNPPTGPIGPSEPWLPPRSPRIQNLQGTRIDPPIAEPWFKPTEQPAPDDKWREFNYTRTRLQEVWMKNAPVKRATLQELLHREGEWTRENMLTVLRVLDKMSLKMEIIIDGDGENIIIQPFEIPYVTEKQYNALIRGHRKY